MNVIYSLSGVSEVIYLVLIPLFVTLVFYGLFVFFYSMKVQDKSRKSYVISFWSNVIGILFGAVLLSVSIGFVIALIRRVEVEGLVVNNQILYTLFCFFPIIPFLFLCNFIRKFIQILHKKGKIDEGEESYEE